MGTVGETPSYEVIIHETADKELSEVPETPRAKLKDRIVEAAELEQPTEHPDIRPMRHADNLFRVRAGRYRALADLSLPNLRVLLVAHREGVYERVEEALERRHE